MLTGDKKEGVINKMFAWYWRKRLIFYGSRTPARVVQVTGLRSALVEGPAGRLRVKFLFKIFKWYF